MNFIVETQLYDEIELYYDDQSRCIVKTPTGNTLSAAIIGQVRQMSLVSLDHPLLAINAFTITKDTTSHAGYTYVHNILDYRYGCWLPPYYRVAKFIRSTKT